MKKKEAVVIHSGGMDSSICLAVAIREFGVDNILSVTYDYGQRHRLEIEKAIDICRDWGVDHKVVKLDILQQITDNALTNHSETIEQAQGQPPTTLVVGRNGLMARIGAILANSLSAHYLYLGIVGPDAAGYRDCSREYMDLKERILRIDLADPLFEIRTPVVHMTKKETMALAHSLGVLDYLLANTVTCYHGIPATGCGSCPSCLLRSNGLNAFLEQNEQDRKQDGQDGKS